MTSQVDPSPRPAEVMLGIELADGWVVTSAMPMAGDATGSTFSVPYIVERDVDGHVERAFLKALDIAKLTTIGHDVARALMLGTVSYEHEKNIVLRCGARQMSNVVKGISAAEIAIPTHRFHPSFGVLATVPYLIFECADGDVRAAIERNGSVFDEAWSLNVMHGIAKGISQLHSMKISHQDVKPSNIMTFGDMAKVGDLGRASDGEAGTLFAGPGNQGDSTYAPPELLYDHTQTNDLIRRWACDIYHVGSMAVFLATGTGMTPLIFKELDPAFHPRSWPNPYRNALPYVRDAYDNALQAIAPRIRQPLRDDLMQLIREMCDPDPEVRGSPKLAGVTRYSIDRYVSIFDRLAKKADMHLKRVFT